MKIKQKYLIGSFLLAFILSFITVLIIYPQFNEFLYTSISNPEFVQFRPTFFVKVVSILLAQTSALGFIFYTIAKKLF